eukprot:GEMP01050880.1.p1 GENE.GEMP01050880.1~~GEMP01050880.1.p1  ORF type:complete len:169 (+),score=49.42 GEMP01050880.1:320-826(+)
MDGVPQARLLRAGMGREQLLHSDVARLQKEAISARAFARAVEASKEDYERRIIDLASELAKEKQRNANLQSEVAQALAMLGATDLLEAISALQRMHREEVSAKLTVLEEAHRLQMEVDDQRTLVEQARLIMQRYVKSADAAQESKHNLSFLERKKITPLPLSIIRNDF